MGGALVERSLDVTFQKLVEKHESIPLGEIAEFRNGVNFTKSSRGKSVKLVGVKDFKNSYFAPIDGLDTITLDGEIPDANLLQQNDILFVRSNGNVELIGRTLLVGKLNEKTTHSGFTIRARLTGKEYSPRFVCWFLKANTTRRQMIDSGTGTNIKSLNQEMLSSIAVPCPSIEEQEEIINRFDQLNLESNSLAQGYSRKVEMLDVLKKSILSEAFSGNI